jgi:hypothetical protein
MPIVIPEGGALITILMHALSGKPCVNVIGCEVVDSTAITQSVADDFSDTIAVAYKAKLSTVSSYDGVHMILGTGSAPAVVDSVSSAGAGVRGAAHLPQQVQALIRKNTGLSGRHFLGRLFLPDLLEGNVDNNGTLNATELGLVQDVADAIGEACSTSPFIHPVLFHSDNSTPTPVASLVAEPQVATLRRRYRR